MLALEIENLQVFISILATRFPLPLQKLIVGIHTFIFGAVKLNTDRLTSYTVKSKIFVVKSGPILAPAKDIDVFQLKLGLS